MERISEINKYPVALINNAFYQWRGRKDYWASLHPEKFYQYCPESTTFIGFKSRDKGDNLISKKERMFQGGTSSLFAVESLLGMGYDEIHLYGVDLTEEPYNGQRKFWKKVVGFNLIDHSYSGWFERREWHEVL